MELSGCCPPGSLSQGSISAAAERQQRTPGHRAAARTRPARPEVEARELHNFWVRISFSQHLSLKWPGCCTWGLMAVKDPRFILKVGIS